MGELALSVSEAAKLLGLSERTVYEMCYHRQIPHRRVQGRGKRGQGKILISRKALERWLEAGELGVTSKMAKQKGGVNMAYIERTKQEQETKAKAEVESYVKYLENRYGKPYKG